MENAVPFEIIGAPYTVWAAPVGTEYPAVDEEPAGEWMKLGTNGDRNYDDNGVTVKHSQSISKWRGLGSTGAVKAFRSDEDLIVSFVLVDLSLEQYGHLLEQTVTPAAAGMGTPGTKTIGLSRGLTVQQYALLVRGPSPYMEDGVMQYEIPVCIQSGEPAPVSKKNAPAALEVQFEALEDPDAASAKERYGRLVAQNADALT